MNEAELNELFASCMPRLRRAASQMLRNAEDCEDALQEGLLSAYRNIDQFQGRSKFSTWLHSIVRNAVRMHLRKVKAQPVWSVESEHSEENENAIEALSVDPGPNPEQVCAQRERSRMLISAIRGLAPRYRMALQLCDVEGIEGKEAARQMGIPLAALKTYLFRGRRVVSQRVRARQVRRRPAFVATTAEALRMKAYAHRGRRYASPGAERAVRSAGSKRSQVAPRHRVNEACGGAEPGYGNSQQRGEFESTEARLSCEPVAVRAKSKKRVWESDLGFPVSAAVPSSSLPSFPC